MRDVFWQMSHMDASNGFGGNVFKFQSDDITLACESLNRFKVKEVTHNGSVRYLGSGSILIVAQDDDTETHRRCCDGEHPTQLATANHANGTTWLNRRSSIVLHQIVIVQGSTVPRNQVPLAFADSQMLRVDREGRRHAVKEF